MVWLLDAFIVAWLLDLTAYVIRVILTTGPPFGGAGKTLAGLKFDTKPSDEALRPFFFSRISMNANRK